MKIIVVISILCLFVSTITAQKPYSLENLKTLSMEELDLYYNKALKNQRTGKVLTIVGGSLGAVGLITATKAHDLGTMVVGAIAALSGGALMAVGIPVSITGKKRVERINAITSTAMINISFDLKPNAQYNLMTQNYQPGITLKISF